MKGKSPISPAMLKKNHRESPKRTLALAVLFYFSILLLFISTLKRRPKAWKFKPVAQLSYNNS